MYFTPPTLSCFDDKAKPIFTKKDEHFLLALVAEEYDVEINEVKGPTRKPHVIRARHAWFYLCYVCIKRDYSYVGGITGRDHTTIMSAIKHMGEKIKLDGEPKEKIAKLIEKFNIQ